MSAYPGTQKFLKDICIPPASLDKCVACGKAGKLKYCAKCAQAVYCSNECQRTHWQTHKTSCGKVELIDLALFYPFLGLLAECFHIRGDKPVHPAMTRIILNDPRPGAAASDLPDGSSAKLVELGDELPLDAHMDPDSKIWWPRAPSQKALHRLRSRVIHEGYVPHVAIALSLALLVEIYTTAASDKEGKPTRLCYRTHPIFDFGIAWGAVRVDPADQLAYQFTTKGDGKTEKFQDPKDHYWIYFTTARGEEVTLDCAMFPFNACNVIPIDPYKVQELPEHPFIPAMFKDRDLRKGAPGLYEEKRRVSVLRNESVHAALRAFGPGEKGIEVVQDVFQQLTSRNIPKAEANMLRWYIFQCCQHLRANLGREAWKTYPREVTIAYNTDPEELDEWLKRKSQWGKIARRNWGNEKKAGGKTTKRK